MEPAAPRSASKAWSDAWAKLRPKLQTQLYPATLPSLKVAFVAGGATSMSQFFDFVEPSLTGAQAATEVLRLVNILNANWNDTFVVVELNQEYIKHFPTYSHLVENASRAVRAPNNTARAQIAPLDSTAQRQALDALKKAISERKLVDLHTHLLGLGDAKFWIDFIMKQYIVALEDRQSLEQCVEEGQPLPAAGTWVDARATEVDLLPLGASPLHGNPREAGGIATYDVVYTLENLCRSFVNDFDHTQRIDSALKRTQVLNTLLQKLGNPVINVQGAKQAKTFENSFRVFTVWNAREQKRELRYGIKNSEMLDFMNASPEFKTRMCACFEMDDSDFNKQEIYRGAFTPHFYPRRYALKDDMYSQYPSVLDKLINYALERYANSGVCYVEFSVGVGDVLRPWIWSHLANPEGLSDTAKSVTFRYLAGFSREQCHALLTGTPGPALSAELKRQAVSLSKTPFITVKDDSGSTKEIHIFEKHLQQLSKLHEAMKRAWDVKHACGINSLCVGLDYFSDEFRRPFCPFSQRPFLDFLIEERARRSENFGYRFHCGECDEAGDAGNQSAYLLAHIGASACVILDVLAAVPDKTATSPPPIRLGHGLAWRHFLSFLKDDAEPAEPQNSNEAQLRQWIAQALREMISRRIPIEVNLTSNNFLEVDNDPALFAFLRKSLTVVLCTDNDGIWPCSHGGFVSVAAEYYAAITGKLAGLKDLGIDKDEVRALVAQGLRASFKQVK